MSTDSDPNRAALAWQTGVWDRMTAVYPNEIDPRFAPVIDHLIALAGPRPGQRILDLGTGTGAVAVRVAPLVAPDGTVEAIDISPAMLAVAQGRFAHLDLYNVTCAAGRAEDIPAGDSEFDAVLASLSLMYAIDRAAAAREIARVLRPGGRFVAAVWAGPEEADLVLFQQTAGRFAPTPPVPGVGPGSLAEPAPFLAQLAAVGIAARVERAACDFDFANFAAAWEALAAVTAAQLPSERREAAQAAVRAAMWPAGDGPRHFRNMTLFIVGERG